MKKDKVVFVRCVDCHRQEIQELAATLHDLDLPYQFLVFNVEVKPLTKDEVQEFIEALKETVK